MNTMEDQKEKKKKIGCISPSTYTLWELVGGQPDLCKVHEFAGQSQTAGVPGAACDNYRRV